MVKTCNICHEAKPIEDFAKHPTAKDHLSYSCRACLNLQAKQKRDKQPERAILRSLINKCSNPNCPSYQYYGAKGIRVCEEWHDYQKFLASIGPRPSKKHTLIRFDEGKGFEPGNCKWALRGCWANRFASPRTKLSAEQVKQIKASLKAGMKGSDLGKKFGVTRACISNIRNNQSWSAHENKEGQEPRS